jgi:hypothetical protein
VDRFARKHSLDLRLITVDHHSGQPFGRPDLGNVRSDLPDETIERHTFSTGGKDWICFRESAPVLFDDSHRNLEPARRAGIRTYKVDNRARGGSSSSLLNQLRAYQRALEADPVPLTVGFAQKHLRRPGEATDEEKEDHRVDRRACFACGRSGHLSRNCPEGTRPAPPRGDPPRGDVTFWQASSRGSASSRHRRN